MRASVREALGQVLTAYVERRSPQVELDPEWPSPCVVGEPDEEDMVAWRPIPMEGGPGPAELSAAVGVTLHADAAEFYTGWWAGEAEVTHEGEGVLLRTLWNENERQTALESLREHFEAQREAGHALSVPVALTYSDQYYALDNRTGEVLLEEPGHPPLRTVAPSLAAFLLALEL